VSKKQASKRKNSQKAQRKVDPAKKFFNPRVRAELWDADYLHLLDPKDLEFYHKFMSEFANAAIQTKKDPLIQEYSRVNKIGYKRAKKEMIGGGYNPIKEEGKPLEKHLHKSPEHPKELFDSNNARNNDVFGVTKINNLLEYDLNGLALKKDVWHETDPEATENAIIDLIDYSRKKKD
jgi:hypothetical protein